MSKTFYDNCEKLANIFIKFNFKNHFLIHQYLSIKKFKNRIIAVKDIKQAKVRLKKLFS